MAQPQQQYPPRTFSPAQSASSSHHGGFLAPNKRQRLSPNPQSPYSPANLGNIALPNQVFSSPYYGAQPNGSPTNNSYAPMNQPPPTGTMGPPPSRPADKPTDMNELSDVLQGSGVDLKEEEAALLNRFNPSSQQQADSSFNSNLSNSFNSTGSSNSGVGPYTNSNNFPTLSQNVPGDRNSFYGAGTFNQPPGPYQSPEERDAAERKRGTRRKAERRQYHLNDPFLYAGWVQRRIFKQAHTMHVTVPSTGLLNSTSQAGRPIEMAVAGPDKHEILTVLQGQDLLYQDAPLVEILTLMSLATEERMRGFVEDAAALAKNRRVTSHGVVPPEFSDIAIGDAAPESVPALPTPTNSAVSPKSNPLKRSFSATNSPLTTIAFPNQVALALQQLSRQERHAEEERLAKRARRAANGVLPGDSTPASETSSFLGERAPDVDTKKGVSKKEQKRQMEAKASEAQLHANTNSTVNMALGGIKKSWMSSASGGRSTPLAPPSRLNTKTSASAGNRSNGALLAPTKGRFGDFREDREGGKGIQLRDLVAVLEGDGKERKALERAYMRLK